MEIKPSFNILFLFFLITLIKYSSSQILIHSNDMESPTIITRQTFTVRSNDGTPVTITKINIHSGRNINSGNDKLTPFDLMRIMDSRVNDFFEEIIRSRINFFNALEQEEEKEKEKEHNIENNKQQNVNNNTIDDKEFELDEEKEENNNKDVNKENNNQKGNKNKKKKKIGKLTVNEDSIKNSGNNNNKKKGKKLSKKEIIFSRVCKYIFYSIIIFTFYILIKKLLEILEIIDPESSEKNVDVNINNNKEEKKETIENEIIVNKEREHKQN